MRRDENERDGTPERAGGGSNRRRMLTQTMVGCGALALPVALVSAPASGNVPDRRGPGSPGPRLRALLDENHGRSPAFGGGLSNHVSMGLYSLSALGGNDDRLARFAESQSRPLEPFPEPDGPTPTPETWTARLGQSQALAGYRAFFGAEMAHLGRERTLRAYLPGLLPGVAAAAFHPLIRTAYGVRFGDDREITDGLAYWAAAFLPLGALGPAGAQSEPRVVLNQMADDTTLAGATLPSGRIYPRLKAAADLPPFGRLASSLRPDEQTLSRIAAATLQLYLATGDFTALHAVTATHAYRLLSPFMAPGTAGVRYHFQAIAAAFVSIGAPRLAAPPSTEAPPWRDIVARTLDSVDAHDLKLVDVARQEEAHYQQPLYRRAAARRMRLV